MPSNDAPTRPPLFLISTLFAGGFFNLLLIYPVTDTFYTQFVSSTAIFFAIAVSVIPPTALAALTAPIFLFRRSALGIIFAWALVPTFMIQTVLLLLSSNYFLLNGIFAFFSFGLFLLLMVALLLKHSYAGLNPKSYGFPIIARFTPEAAAVSPIPQPEVPMPIDYPAAASARRLATTALILRIIGFCLLGLNLLYIPFACYAVFFRFYGTSMPFSVSSRMYAGPEIWLQLGVVVNQLALPFLMIGLFILGTYILSALADLISSRERP